MIDEKTAITKVVVGELNWCKAAGVKSYDEIRERGHPFFTEKFDNIKDVSEVIGYDRDRDLDLAILKVIESSVFFISPRSEESKHGGFLFLQVCNLLLLCYWGQTHESQILVRADLIPNA